MKKLLVLTGILLLAVLVGCAPTTGTNREYDIPISIDNTTGTVSINLELKVDATSAAEQTSSPIISPTTRLQLAEEASSIASEAGKLKDVANSLSKKLSSDNVDNTKNNTDNISQPAAPEVITEEQGTVEEVENVQDAEGAVKEGE